MTTPAYLDEAIYPFDFDELFALADVETGGVGVITALRTMLVTNLGWSEPSTALFKTPVDASSRWLDVLVTRISATVIEWRVRNAAGVTVCTRRITLGTGAVRLYGSTQGIMIEFVQTSQNGIHHAFAFVLDPTPNLISDHSLYVFGGGYLTTAGTNDSLNDTYGEGFAIDNGSAGSIQRAANNAKMDGVVINSMSASGKLIYNDSLIYISFSGVFKIAGRIVQCLRGESSFNNGGDEKKVYIDTDIAAVFKAVGTTSNHSLRWMMRKS